jgi:hypothetical protein
MKKKMAHLPITPKSDATFQNLFEENAARLQDADSSSKCDN